MTLPVSPGKGSFKKRLNGPRRSRDPNRTKVLTEGLKSSACSKVSVNSWRTCDRSYLSKFLHQLCNEVDAEMCPGVQNVTL